MPDSMLINVLGAYLDSVKEREFDLPFLALLHASGFYDVHFTHGNAEYGKDFIAKRNENGTITQYSFQSKAGDVSQSDWRDNIMGQILESLLSNLSHPNFDKNAPHRTILVITGKMLGNAALNLQDLNDTIVQKFHKLPIEIWDREILIPMLEKYGLGSIYATTASDFTNYGKFYEMYAKTLNGIMSQREIEGHFLQWIDPHIDSDKRLLCSVIESSIFGSQCQSKGMLYEEIVLYLATMRTIAHQIFHAKSKDETNKLVEVYSLAVISVKNAIKEYLSEAQNIWMKAGKDLSSIISSPNNMLIYSMQCSRIIEVAGCGYFLESNKSEKEKIIAFLVDFISKEPGCAHIVSDYYAVSIVLPVLALCTSDHRDIAKNFLCNSTVWLCDRYQQGFGLGRISAGPHEEIATLFGYPFEFIKTKPRKGSFAATVMCDLAAFLADKQLYTDIVNDIKASRICPEYFQVPDTESLFRLDGTDILTYPNVNYSDTYLPFESFSFADHIKVEPRTFRLTDYVGIISPFVLMFLLRDRYFPCLWLQLK